MKKKTKKATKQTFGNFHFNLFKQAFHWDKTFAMTFIFDAAYCIAVLCFFFLFVVVAHFIVAPLFPALQTILAVFTQVGSSYNPTTDTILTTEFDVISWFYIKAAFLLIGGLAGFFAVTSCYKAMIWLHLTKQNRTITYFKKFFFMNMTWQLLWFIVAVLIFFIFDVAPAAALLTTELIAYMYFTPFFRQQLTQWHSWKKLYKETFLFGITKLRKFIIPLFLMLITFVFSLWIIFIFGSLLSPAVLSIFFLLFIVFTITWVRFYFAIVAKHVL